MKDSRINKLSCNILDHSVKLKTGENIFIEIFDKGEELAAELIKEVYKRGANPFLSVNNKKLLREVITGANQKQLEQSAKYDILRMKEMDACVSIRGTENVSEFNGISSGKIDMYQSIYNKPINTDIRLANTKWCVLNYPTAVLAQMSGMNSDEFEDFYFNVCCLDYYKMGKKMEVLQNVMQTTDNVHIISQDTELSFSIKGMNIVVSDGINNLPDGEVSVAPLIESSNGYITYNTQSEYLGFTHQNVKLELKDGKIVKATSNNSKKTNSILDIDNGARFIGEFAIGLNPYITKPINNTLFDEKATGSIHFTPGNAYAASFNGNRSGVHWDLVLMQTLEYGGGEIWFDDVLIRKDGLFVTDVLKCLNPDNLKENI